MSPRGGKRPLVRLPLQVAQVLYDALVWRAHQRNHRDACAETALVNLRESTDVLDRWLANIDPDFCVGESTELSVARAPNPNAPKLRVVKDDDKQ